MTAKSNRSKADKDLAQRLPPTGGSHCEYAAQWTETMPRAGPSRSTMPSARAGVGLSTPTSSGDAWVAPLARPS
ncbi:hypothetical protein ACWCP7_35890, partial [Streptomyces goshikiensis]